MVVEVSEAPQYGSQASIIPGGVLQFFDFDLNVERLEKVKRDFLERDMGQDASGQQQFKLVCLDEDPAAGRKFDRKKSFLQSGDRGERESYTIKAAAAINDFAGEWLPIPLFKVAGPGPHGTVHYSHGPSNWARLYIHRLAEEDRKKGNSHRIVLAFDTQ